MRPVTIGGVNSLTPSKCSPFISRLGALTVSWVACLSILSSCEGSALVANSGPIKVGNPNNPTPAWLQGEDPATKTCGAGARPGHAMIHRLTNGEYDNTVRDLLFVPSTRGSTFASSSIGSGGFTNQSDVLTLSDQLLADYGRAAEGLADEVLATKDKPDSAWSKVAGCVAQAAKPSADCAERAVKTLAERAFRRPVDSDDVNALMAVYKGEPSAADGFHDVVIALLIDPRFIFSAIFHETPDDPAAVHKLDPYELASRLSYFLWQSMPDDTLFSLAADGTLSEPTVMSEQVARMLADPKAKSVANVFRRDWARLSVLEGEGGYGKVSAETTADLRRETELLTEDIFGANKSLFSFVSSDSTFVNANLAAFYGWPTEGLTNEFSKVKIPTPERRGILTTGAVMLAHGGGGTYSHPVQRGRWVLDSLFCASPPPPPANIDTTLPPSSSDLPMRERLAAHTKLPQCKGCHRQMDVWGLGLENFDMSGQYRTTYEALNNAPIDASGMLPDGRSFANGAEMLDVLKNSPEVASCMAEKVMTFALARKLEGEADRCATSALGEATVTPTSNFSSLLAALVQTRQFQFQEGVAP